MKLPLNKLPPRSHPHLLLAAVKEADIIRAVDPRTGGSAVVYGVSVLQAIADEVIPPQTARLLEFEVGFEPESQDLEYLCAAVQAVKGFHECSVIGGR